MIGKFNTNGSLTQSITANTSSPFGIAVDQYQDLYVISGSVLAIDDPTGASLWTMSVGSPLSSVKLGCLTVATFYDNTYVAGSGSFGLRTGNLQYGVGPTGSVAPIGSACLIDRCWYDDAFSSTPYYEVNGSAFSISLPYAPAGVAYDALHNRLFISARAINKIQVCNAMTIAFERSIT